MNDYETESWAKLKKALADIHPIVREMVPDIIPDGADFIGLRTTGIGPSHTKKAEWWLHLDMTVPARHDCKEPVAISEDGPKIYQYLLAYFAVTEDSIEKSSETELKELCESEARKSCKNIKTVNL